MALEIRTGLSKWWYGRVMVNGKKITRNLGVKIEGTPPASLKDFGDPLFERSRSKAQAALEKLQDEFKKRSTAEELVQTVHEIRTGTRINSLPLADMFKRWKALPRRRASSTRYVAVAGSYFVRFQDFLTKSYPVVKDAADVQADMVREYLKSEEERGVSPKTYNNTLIFLRSCFETLTKEAGLVENPFDGIPTKEEDTVFRKPFSTEELTAIIEAAKSDPFIEPIIITGMCTAMRRGDCCLLPWEAVNLETRFINVKTSKTGETVQIPIFPLLEAVLKATPRDGSDFVFPEQAAMYQSNPDGITLRVRKVLEKAGFRDDAEEEGDPAAADAPSIPASRGALSLARKTGLRRASVRDFHSFRVTWVTLALTAGVPMELVQRVTGHRTAQIVQKHYFQPGAEDFRKALSTKLPSLMAGTSPAASISPDDLRTKLKAMTPKNWRVIRDEILTSL